MFSVTGGVHILKFPTDSITALIVDGIIPMFIVTLMLLSMSSYASKNEVRWATPYWPGLTNKDSFGLYDSLVKAALPDSKINRKLMPWRRARFEVLTGKSDMTGGIIKGYSAEILISECPIYDRVVGIVYRTAYGESMGHLGLLSNGVGVSIIGFLDDKPILRKMMKNVYFIPEETNVIGMLLAGRAAYFVAPFRFIENELEVTGHASREKKILILEKLYESELYMVFTKSERGNALKLKFDSGIRSLYISGKLHKIYREHNTILPKNVKCFQLF